MQHSIAPGDSINSAEDGFQAALLPAYIDRTLDHSSTCIGELALSFPILSTLDSLTCKALVRERAAVKARMMHIKKYHDSLQNTVDVNDVNVRLQLFNKVWEEYSTVQDLEYNDDDDETQQHELDMEAFTETYCVLRDKIDRIISEDR